MNRDSVAPSPVRASRFLSIPIEHCSTNIIPKFQSFQWYNYSDKYQLPIRASPVSSHNLKQCWDIVNWTLGRTSSEILIEILTFSLRKMHLKMFWKMSDNLSLPQCVNSFSFRSLHWLHQWRKLCRCPLQVKWTQRIRLKPTISKLQHGRDMIATLFGAR